MMGGSLTLYGQNFSLTRPDDIGGSFVGTRQDQGQIGSSGMGPGLEMFLKYNLSKSAYLKTGLGIGSIYDNMFSWENVKVSLVPSFDLLLGYNLSKTSNFVPFVFGGVTAHRWTATAMLPSGGSYTSDSYYDGGIVAGGGFEFPVSDNWKMHASADYRYILSSAADDKPQYYAVKTGFSYSPQKNGTRKYEGEEIEYPLDNNELSYLDDLFELNGDGGAADDEPSSEEDALALLFQPEAAESGTSEINYPDTEVGRLMAKINMLRNEMDNKMKKIETLENQVAANEKAISSLESGQGQYMPAEQGSFGVSSSDEFKRNYESALQKFYARQYNDAIRILKNLLVTNPDNRLASNCQYWIGECYNAMGRYQDAIQAFNNVMRYRTSYKFDDALIMTGMIHLKMGDNQTARQQFEELVNRYPDSEYINKALRYLGQL